MKANNLPRASVLYGIEGPTADALRGVLEQLGCSVYRLEEGDSPDDCGALAAEMAAEVIFCGEIRPRYQELLRSLDRLPQPPAVVVTSRIPETAAWLDALDEGAFDYCGAPFEPQLIRWILEGARLRCQRSDSARSSAAAAA